jgi:serine/threonine-protein kinase HipA
VLEPEDGPPIFEYAEEFRSGGLELSPRFLPLSLAGPRTFPELARSAAFEGLPGVLADALPDRFGNAVIRRYFEARGTPQAALSPVQKLLYVGERAMGALTFHPAHKLPAAGRESEALELATLVSAARQVVEGSPEVALPEIMRISASAGGQRAKAVVLWNEASGELRSAFASRRPGDEDWLIKLDGVGEVGHPHPEALPFNRVEAAYAELARAAGIEMAPTRLLEEHGRAHFMTRRFDRVQGARLHMHSLGGMEHVDYNVPGLYSYEQWLRLLLELELGAPVLEQAFRRAVFNVLCVNQDDHVKNIGFLMGEDGRWRLAPAFDLTFARGQGYTRSHQMSLAEKRDGFAAADLLGLAERFGIRHGARLVREVAEALRTWPARARETGVPGELIRFIAAAHRFDAVP